MAEYIDKNKLENFAMNCVGGEVSLRQIHDFPAADVVERKRGKWVGYPECLKYMNAYADDHIVCSACEECFSILDNDCERFNFCPNCGADMRQEKGDGNV